VIQTQPLGPVCAQPRARCLTETLFRRVVDGSIIRSWTRLDCRDRCRSAQRTVINTGGGAFIGGNLDNRGGTFIGRDKIVYGDEVHGDKVLGDKTTVGAITGSTIGVIGRVEQSTVIVGVPAADLEHLFAPIMAAAQQADPAQRQAAEQAAQELKVEAGKGKKADDTRLARLIDGLVGLVPAAVTAVVSAFASPILAGVAGPVTHYVLQKLSGK
jgi:hypothetical protein